MRIESQSICCVSCTTSMMSESVTPRKSLSPDICRVCSSSFANTRDKHNLFRSSYKLAEKLEQATGLVGNEDDGLPQFVCGSCRNTILKYHRVQRELVETTAWLVDRYTRTVPGCRFKRGAKDSPTYKPSTKKPDLSTSPAALSQRYVVQHQPAALFCCVHNTILTGADHQ